MQTYEIELVEHTAVARIYVDGVKTSVMNNTVIDTKKISRVEVINHQDHNPTFGRAFAKSV